MRLAPGFVVLAAAVISVHIVHASELVREFKGDKSGDTAGFEVEAPWVLDWRVSSTFDSSLAVEVSLVEAGTGMHVGKVLGTRWAGNGVRLFDEGGRYRFRVHSTMANWTLRVEQLTPAEARLYTPRERVQPAQP